MFLNESRQQEIHLGADLLPTPVEDGLVGTDMSPPQKRRLNPILRAELSKPLDASDLTELGSAKAEIVRLRRLAKRVFDGEHEGADPQRAWQERVQLVVSDVDETLGKGGRYSDRLLAALEAFTADGGFFVPMTGQPAMTGMRMLRPLFRHATRVGFCNGVHVCDPAKDFALDQDLCCFLGRVQVAEILTILMRDVVPALPEGAKLELICTPDSCTKWVHVGETFPAFFKECWQRFHMPEGSWMGNAKELASLTIAEVIAKCKEEVPETSPRDDDKEEAGALFPPSSNFRSVGVMVRGWGDVQLIDCLKRTAPALLEHFNIGRGGLRNKDGTALVEVGRQGGDKGACGERVRQLLGVAIEGTAAFGDAVNDISMLKWAGTGVVVGNGEEAAKEAADVVLKKTFKEDAVACVLEQIVAARKAARERG